MSILTAVSSQNNFFDARRDCDFVCQTIPNFPNKFSSMEKDSMNNFKTDFKQKIDLIKRGKDRFIFLIS